MMQYKSRLYLGHAVELLVPCQSNTRAVEHRHNTSLRELDGLHRVAGYTILVHTGGDVAMRTQRAFMKDDWEGFEVTS